jgi:outer membrane autotransporter protein
MQKPLFCFLLSAACLYATTNIQSVSNVITELTAAGELTPGLTTVQSLLVGQPYTSTEDAYDQLHPAHFSSFTELQEEVNAKIISLFQRKPYLPYIDSNAVRMWITPFGDSLTEKTHGEQLGFTVNTGGIALGIDHNLADNWVFGLGAAWDHNYLEWHFNSGHANVDSIYGSLYSDWQFWDFYLGTSIYGSVDFFDTKRHIQFLFLNEHASASFTGYEIVAQLATAYYFGIPTAFFYPYANLDFLFCHRPHYSEHGSSLNLSVNGNSSSTLRTEIGLALQLTDLNYDETMGITPFFSLGWVNMAPLERQHYTATFSGTPISFTTHGWDETWNLFSLDFALGFFYKSFFMNIEYSPEMSVDSHTLLYNHYGNISFQWKW